MAFEVCHFKNQHSSVAPQIVHLFSLEFIYDDHINLSSLLEKKRIFMSLVNHWQKCMRQITKQILATTCATSIPQDPYLESWLFHFLCSSLLRHLEGHQMIAQLLGPLPPTAETPLEFQASSYNQAQSKLLGLFGEWTGNVRSLFLLVCNSTYQIKF